MDIFIIGKLIKEFRERKNISQEELSFDLCAVSTLSKIENGKQSPSKKTAEALLSRLGIHVPTCNFQMTQLEIDRWNLECEIDEKISSDNFEFSDLLKKYKDLSEMDFLENQKYTYYLALYENYHGTEKEEVKNRLIEALKFTIPEFTNIDELGNRFLTADELIIFNNIALICAELEDITEAVKIEKYLFNYYEEKSVSEEEKSKTYPVILFNLANWVEIQKNYQEMLFFAEEGIKNCNKYDFLSYFPLQLFNKGWALNKLGKIEESKEIIYDSLKIMKYANMQEQFQEAEEIAKREFNFDFNL